MTQVEVLRAQVSGSLYVGTWRFPSGAPPHAWCAILLITPDLWRGSARAEVRRAAAERLALRYAALGIAVFLVTEVDSAHAPSLLAQVAEHPLASRRRRREFILSFETEVPSDPSPPSD